MKYRLLKIGEIIRRGDQWRCTDKIWKPVHSTIDSQVLETEKRHYRRPIRPRKAKKTCAGCRYSDVRVYCVNCIRNNDDRKDYYEPMKKKGRTR